MKKLLLLLLLLLLPSVGHASGHLEARRADIITIGTLPNNVLDNSSVTKQGNNFVIPLSQSVSQVNQLATDTTTLRTLIPSVPAKPYDIIVGTPGMPNTDFNIAVSSDLWAPLTALGANGLTRGLMQGPTVQGVVLFVGGSNFNVANATVPEGITFAMIDGSSTCWTPQAGLYGTSSTIVTVYGKLKNFCIDGSSQPGYTSQKIVFSTNSVADGLLVRNFPFVSQIAAPQYNIISITRSTNVYIKDLVLDNFSSRSENPVPGNMAAIYVDYTTSVYFVNPVLKRFQGTGVPVAFTFYRSVDWHILGGISYNAFSQYINIAGGNVHWEIKDHVFHINNTYSNGIISGNANDTVTSAGGNSTGTIRGCTFFHEPGAVNSPIINLVNTTYANNGWIMTGNYFYNRSGATTVTGIAVGAGQSDNWLIYNFPEGVTSYTDSGTRTRIIQ